MRQRDLFRLMWLEYRCAKQYTASQSFNWIAQSGYIPGWFIKGELGYSYMNGPSLEETLNTLHITNKRNMEILEMRDPESVPLKKRPKYKLTGETANKRLVQALKRKLKTQAA